MHRTVQDVMTTEVITVAASAPFKELVGVLEEHRVSALPVVDDRGVVVGLVSEADLLAKERYPHGSSGVGIVEALRHRGELYKAAGVTAAELMSSPAVTTSPTATLPEAARLAAAAGVKRLPVVDADGRLVGIVSRADLLKVFLRPDDELRREVAEELVGPYTWPDPQAVTVEVADGVVTLRGRLKRRSQAGILVQLAQSVDGVVRVDGELGYDVDDAPPVAPIPLTY